MIISMNSLALIFQISVFAYSAIILFPLYTAVYAAPLP